MAMSKSCYNGCYNRRSCYNHGCCNQQSSGVSTGSLLAAGVAASLLVLALDCDDTTTTTTTTCTATAVGLDDPFSYVLPGAASTDKTALQQAAARQPLGLFGYPGTMATAPNSALAAASTVITYGFTANATATAATVFSSTAGNVGLKNVPIVAPFTTLATLVNSYQISVNLSPLFTAVVADSSYATLNATNVQQFLSTAGYTNSTDTVYSVDLQIQGLNRFYEAVGAGAGGTGVPTFTANSTAFPAISSAVTLQSATAVIATYGTIGVNGVQSLYDGTSDITSTTQTGKVSLFQTTPRYTTNITTYAGITVPTQASYTSVPVSSTGGDSAYSVTFTVADITGAVATGATAYVVRFLAWRSTYTPQPQAAATTALAGTATSGLTIIQNSNTAANGQTFSQAANNLGAPAAAGNVGVLLQYAFSYTFKPATRGFFARTGNTTNSVYTYSGGATTRGQSGGVQANNDTQISLTQGTDVQCLAIVEVGSGPVA